MFQVEGIPQDVWPSLLIQHPGKQAQRGGVSSKAAELLCGSTGSWASGSQVGGKCHWMFVIPGALFPVIFHGQMNLHLGGLLR